MPAPSFLRLASITALLACILTPLRAQSPTDAPSTFPTFSLTDLQNDFDQFARTATNQHPQLYTDRTAFQNALTTTRAQLREGMNELEFFHLLADLTRRLNCGHTSLALSSATDAVVTAQRRLLPFAARFIDGRLFVTRVLPGANIPLRAEILDINAHSTSAILARLLDHRPADGANLTFKLNAINHRFAELYHLLIDLSSTFSITYLDPITRTSATAQLQGVSSTEWSQLTPPAPPDNNGLGSTTFAADRAVLFVKSFFYYDAPSRARFNAFVDAFFNEVAARQIPNVILDVRGNGGGDPYCGAYLFRKLIDRALPYFTSDTAFYPDLKPALAPASNAFHGALYVLVDGGCFSTTGHFLSLLRYHGIGRFIGEETGGSFACTSNNLSTTLGRTHLRLSYATSTFTTAVSGLTPGRGLMPHFPITATAADHIHARDVALELAHSLIVNGPTSAAITRSPESITASANGQIFFSLQTAQSDATLQWEFNGASLPGATSSTFSLAGAQLTDAGLYAARVTTSGPAQLSRPAILGFVSTEKTQGGFEIGPDILHPNGKTFDQILLQQTAASITADSDQVTRLSFVDLQNDIVQVEFTGAGTLSLSLDAATPPAAPLHYHQPGIQYIKGHARLVIQGANETTHVSIFSVGRANAENSTLFRNDVTYDGWADVSSLSILSANGKFGGIYAGNARFTGTRGPIGLVCPDVDFTGPINLGDLHAADDATPMILLGSAATTRIAGGNLEQLNARAVQVSGIAALQFVAGTDSHGRSFPAQTNLARFEQNGTDVTTSLIQPLSSPPSAK